MEINSLPFIQRNVLTNLEKRTTKGKKPNTFADTLQDASQQVESKQDKAEFTEQGTGDIAKITENGKKSTGQNPLTDVQKQYLRSKYNLSDPSKLSPSKFNQLLTDLTNGGALSYHDYMLTDVRPGPPKGVVIAITYHQGDSFLSPPKSYGEYMQKVVQGEKQEADYIQNCGAEVPSSYNDCIEAHGRIENLLSSLLK